MIGGELEAAYRGIPSKQERGEAVQAITAAAKAGLVASEEAGEGPATDGGERMGAAAVSQALKVRQR